MAKIAFILLCHKDPEAIIKQAERLTAVGDYMSIHFDARAKPEFYATGSATRLTTIPTSPLPAKRVKCGWGEWSLVQATLLCRRSRSRSVSRARPISTCSRAIAWRSNRPNTPMNSSIARMCDYVESFDYFESDWIKTGWKEERLIYRHWFNERSQKRRFYAMFEAPESALD